MNIRLDLRVLGVALWAAAHCLPCLDGAEVKHDGVKLNSRLRLFPDFGTNKSMEPQHN